ncbi:serine/threonine kinase [Aureococcus anophagefferens]|nr:serine/threonine kinase [Aureococcus anophagefferens]
MQFEARRPPARCDLLRCWRMATGAGSDDDSDGERDSSFCLPSAAGSSAPWASAPIAKRSGTSWATKVITEEQLRGGQFGALADQFATEIAALRSCHHPNIIRLEDAIITDGCLYLVLEHLRGGELFDYVVARGTLASEASGILRDLASAVRYMHAKGIIHRDLKPENLLLTREPPPGMVPEVKIIDRAQQDAHGAVVDRDVLPRHAGLPGAGDAQAPALLQGRGHVGLRRHRRILLCGCLPFGDDSAKVSSPLLGRKFELRYPSWAQSLSAGARASWPRSSTSTRSAARRGRSSTTVAQRQRAATSLLRSPAMLRHVPRTPKAHRPPPPPAAASRPPAHRAVEDAAVSSVAVPSLTMDPT